MKGRREKVGKGRKGDGKERRKERVRRREEEGETGHEGGEEEGKGGERGKERTRMAKVTFSCFFTIVALFLASFWQSFLYSCK